MKALAALAGAAFTVAACYGLGSMIAARLGARLRRDEKFPLAFVLGAAVLHLAIFAVMALHIAYRPVLIALLAACVAAALVTGDWRLPAAEDADRETPLPRAIRYLFGVIAAAFTVLYLFNAWAPEISPDGSSYHLSSGRALFAGSRIQAGTDQCLLDAERGRRHIICSGICHWQTFRRRADAFRVSDRAGAGSFVVRQADRPAAGRRRGRAAGVFEPGGWDRRDLGL